MFVVLEGIEGSGKSSAQKRVAQILKSKRVRVLCTREPGGTRLSERIRPILLKTDMTPWAEVFFYQALRAEHVSQVIRPALKKGFVVLCDRFSDSTLAYQGEARGLRRKTLVTLNQLATQGLKPDLVCWLDVSPRVGLSRAKNPNRFEREGLRFQAKARKGFQKCMNESPKRWLKLDSEKLNQEAIAQSIAKTIARHILKAK